MTWVARWYSRVEKRMREEPCDGPAEFGSMRRYVTTVTWRWDLDDLLRAGKSVAQATRLLHQGVLAQDVYESFCDAVAQEMTPDGATPGVGAGSNPHSDDTA